MRFLEKGYTYFDTSYVYHNGKSEEFTRKALVERHPRESFTLATKLPTWAIKSEEDVKRNFCRAAAKTAAQIILIITLSTI